ncbi:MAG: division/cell wall cluster transcriptional repressor MraZ [Desulfovibrionaceae bacterium]
MHFVGSHPRTLDPKGRLMLPPAFRDVLLARSQDGEFVMTTHDGCVTAFAKPDWEEMLDSISSLPLPPRRVRDFRRLVVGGMQLVSLDKQGRVLMAQSLCDYAGLGKDVILVGQGHLFEVWSQERLDAVRNQDFDDVVEDLTKLGGKFPF